MATTPKKAKGKSKAKPITDLDDEAAIVRKIDEIRADRELAIDSKNAWTAVGSLHKQESDLLARLAELRKVPTEAADDGSTAGLSDADLVALVVDAIPSIGDEAFDRLALAVQRRLGKPSLRVVDGT